MDFSVFDSAPPDIEVSEASRLSAEYFGVEGEAMPLAGERDRSFRISGADGDFYLKVGHAADHPAALEGQAAAVVWAKRRDPSLPLAPVIPAVDGRLVAHHGPHALALSEFLRGDSVRGSVSSPGLRRSVGRIAARISRALRGFDHEGLHRDFPWTLTLLPDLADLVEYLPEEQRAVVRTAFERLVDRTMPKLDELPGQATHGDLNRDNLLVDPGDPERIVGVFDFGDLSWSPRVVEAAIASAYQSVGADPVAATAQVVSAFHVEDPLSAEEVALVPELVAGRCIQSLLMSARHVALSPGDHGYATSDTKEVYETLVALEEAGREAEVLVLSACGFSRGDRPATSQVIETRQGSVAPSLRLSYDTPVHAASARGMWITDRSGNRLLDAYNNVPHVGHAHPQVVAALSAQSRRLTTNTRYLADGVAEYAERLAGLLPDLLSTVFFVNSGSEANDLAYRIAATVTARRGVITTANAYHGATAFSAAISPEELKTDHRERWTASIGGGELLADPEAAAQIRGQLDGAAAHLDASGEQAAMVICDTVFSSDGIFDVPTGMLDATSAWSRQNGALLVADEVQAGFGRVGARFWGFAADGAVPDIVTLGKPIGNGHPMGAVVTSSEVAGAFAENAHFFSTFAGSPVAAAVGSAVLDVIDTEELAANADEVGAYLRAAIADLESPHIRDVRGPGLFIGVELDDGQRAATVVNAMRDRGVLIGSTGAGHDVLKIRPPLVCTTAHADRIVDTLQRCLRAIS